MTCTVRGLHLMALRGLGLKLIALYGADHRPIALASSMAHAARSSAPSTPGRAKA